MTLNILVSQMFFILISNVSSRVWNTEMLYLLYYSRAFLNAHVYFLIHFFLYFV